MNTFKKNVIYLAVLIIGIVIGIVLATFVTPESESADSFEAGWQAAKERLVENNYLSSNYDTKEVKELMGEVIEVNENGFTIRQASNINPLADTELKTRIVNIGSGVKIINKTTSEELSLNQITQGSIVSVKASDDIKEAKTFEAEEVNIILLK